MKKSGSNPASLFHGFRYVEVHGLEDRLRESDVEGIVVSSKLPVAGTFTCSDSKLNELNENISWSVWSNI
ncbi:bacterial alpha-L-rhamnosidase [Aspergillus alliaceus]|uniref:bacterial alpha-L-rhamnosidase n=1 Tax=Petromyces alliaceus TaxID=209559 RepID=UPI0012A5D076|nr:bacterial alpha-L-rhamnosidase [Aspergillus alliaceus]KAB8231666.1 bacterial alpha-L-rhamnosidase [Aspergillus alliaceus]